jgi:hypothetical protein
MLVFGAALYAEEDAVERARVLVDRLGSESWPERERATRELKTLGKDALPALRGALTDSDAEVRARASATLIEIGEDFGFSIESIRSGDENLQAHGRAAIANLLGLDEPDVIRVLGIREIQSRHSGTRQSMALNNPPELALLRMQAVTGMPMVVAPCAEASWRRILEQPQLTSSFSGDFANMRWLRDLMQRQLNNLLGNPQNAGDQISLNVVRIGREHFYYVTSAEPPSNIVRDCTNRLIEEFLSDGPERLRAAALLGHAVRGNSRLVTRLSDEARQEDAYEGLYWLALALERAPEHQWPGEHGLASLLGLRDWQGLELLAKHIHLLPGDEVARELMPVVEESGDALQVALALWVLRGQELSEPARARVLGLLASRQDTLAAAAVRWLAGAGEVTDAELAAFWQVCEFQQIDSQFFRAAVELAERADVITRLEDRARNALDGLHATQQAVAAVVLKGRTDADDLKRVLNRLQATRANEALVQRLRALFRGVSELDEESTALLQREIASEQAGARAAYQLVLLELGTELRATIAGAALEKVEERLKEAGESPTQGTLVLRIELLGIMAGTGSSSAFASLQSVLEDDNVELARAAGKALVNAIPGDEFFDGLERLRDNLTGANVMHGVLEAALERCRRAVAEEDPRSFRRAYSIAMSIQVPNVWQIRNQLNQLQGQLTQRVGNASGTHLPVTLELRRFEVDVN